MQRRLTQLFPFLLGRQEQENEENVQVHEEVEAVDRATDEQLQELREQTKEIFKGKSWTRIVCLNDALPEEKKAWPIAPDLADEYDTMFTIDEDALPESQPAFDPYAFAKTNPDPQVGAWSLPEQKFKELCQKVSAVRKRIKEKAEE